MREDASRTVLLTTHYMLEADELCDRVAIINRGRVLACDTPSKLKQRLQREAIFRLETAPLDAAGTGFFAAIPGVRNVAHSAEDGHSKIDLILQEEQVLGAVLAAMEARGIALRSLNKHQPTLEDVFVDLVGRSMAEVEVSGEPAGS
jgi:ABC-2 type transport system ATP-binding protein